VKTDRITSQKEENISACSVLGKWVDRPLATALIKPPAMRESLTFQNLQIAQGGKPVFTRIFDSKTKISQIIEFELLFIFDNIELVLVIREPVSCDSLNSSR
jgi:hypothetical protein